MVLLCEPPSVFIWLSLCVSQSLLGSNFISMGHKDAFSSPPCKNAWQETGSWEPILGQQTINLLFSILIYLHALFLTLVFFLPINSMYLLHPVIQANKEKKSLVIICNSNYKDTIIRGESEVYQLQETSAPSNDSALINLECLKISEAQFKSDSYAYFSIFKLREIKLSLFLFCLFKLLRYSNLYHWH